MCFTYTIVQLRYCQGYVALSAIFVAHSALPTYNAALNRPAYQSSVYPHPNGNCSAGLANDGNHETNAYKDNNVWCAVSRDETNPWWAVDLGRPTTIYRVDLTNIGGVGVGMYLFCFQFHNVYSYCLVLFFLYMFDVFQASVSVC